MLVAFQPNLTDADLATFMQAYNVTIADQPTAAEGAYRLRVADDYPADQMAALVESMKGQTEFVSDVAIAN